jgi:hypothetical protein
MAFDGETALQYFYPITPSVENIRPLDLPNITLEDCCSDKKILVLANDGENIDENDFTSFLYCAGSTTSDAVYSLYKETTTGFELKLELDGDDIGINYPFGFAQFRTRKYVGYRINWFEVLSLFGEGIYKVQLDITDSILGNSVLSSEMYKLCTYTPMRAKGTVRINWTLNGTIGDVQSTQINLNYLNLNWQNQLRLPGWFGFPTAEYLNEFVRYQNGLEEWTKMEQTAKYNLQIKRIPFNLLQIIRIQIIMSDRATITDYNPTNNNVWQDFPIKFNTGFEPKYEKLRSELASVELIVEQRFNNLKKFR